MAGKSPLDEFNKCAVNAFDALLLNIDNEIVKTLKNANITENGLDLEKEGLKAPSATWTYLINDSPEQLGIAPICRSPIAAALNAPLLVSLAIVNRFFRKTEKVR